jgi:hypothetical protein
MSMSILGPNQPPDEKPDKGSSPGQPSPAERFRSIAAASKVEKASQAENLMDELYTPEALMGEPPKVEKKVTERPKQAAPKTSAPKSKSSAMRFNFPKPKPGQSDPNAPSIRQRIMHPDKEKVRVAYWNVTGTISLIINAVLIAALIILSRMVFQLGQMANKELLFNGFYVNFGKLDAAHIRATIQVNQQIPISFPLTINQQTAVTLTQDTRIDNTDVVIHSGILNINAQDATVTLPAGTVLPIQLNMVVPVQASIPIALTVPVDIPLSQTELHEPFSDLQATLEPFIAMIYQKTDWEKMGFCKAFHGICSWWFYP